MTLKWISGKGMRRCWLDSSDSRQQMVVGSFHAVMNPKFPWKVRNLLT